MQRSSIDFTSENIKFIQVNYFIDGLLIISNSYIIQRKKNHRKEPKRKRHKNMDQSQFERLEYEKKYCVKKNHCSLY